MTLAERLAEYVRAAFSGIYIRSHEHDDAIAEIARLCRDQGWSLATWDVDRGLAIAGRTDGRDRSRRRRPAGRDPLAGRDGHARGHRDPGAPQLPQVPRLGRGRSRPSTPGIAAGKQDRTFVVILAPVVQVPVELEKLFVVIEHDLPGRDQLEAIARAIATEPGELPEGDGLAAVLDAAAGLTRRRGRERLQPLAGPPRPARPRRALGAQGGMLKKSGLLTLHRGGETFADLGGLDGPQVVLLAGPAARPARGARAGACSCWGRRARESRRSQGPGERDRPADADARRRHADRLAGRPDARRTSARPCGWSTRWPRAW